MVNVIEKPINRKKEKRRREVGLDEVRDNKRYWRRKKKMKE